MSLKIILDFRQKLCKDDKSPWCIVVADVTVSKSQVAYGSRCGILNMHTCYYSTRIFCQVVDDCLILEFSNLTK